MKIIKNRPVVIVIGGGPSGLMAAGTAASLGADVILLEKNSSCGKKLLLTGSGKCNITNNAPLDVFLDQFAENKKFLYPAFKEMFSHELELFFNKYQVIFQIEQNGKIFPTTKKSSSVLLALLSYCLQYGVKILLEEPVMSLERTYSNGNAITTIETDTLSNSGNAKESETELEYLDSINMVASDANAITTIGTDVAKKWTVTTTRNQYTADSVIIATGGLSYPKSGSSGDGYKLAMKFCHSIVPTRPALVPVEIADPWCASLSGVSLKDVTICLWENVTDKPSRKLATEKGDLLFTHFGLSGPSVLFISRWLPDSFENNFEPNKFYIEIDLYPSKSKEEFESMLLNLFNKTPSRQIKTILNKEFDIPLSVANAIVLHCGFKENTTCQDVTKNKRKILISSLKALKFPLLRTRGYNEAMVTAGGVSTKEIRPQTMESKISTSLFFAGEVLDIDGYTGGFNLQAALSTGYLAGRNAAKC